MHNKRGRTTSDGESDDKVAKRSRKKSPKRGRQENDSEDEHLRHESDDEVAKRSRKKSPKRGRQENDSEDEHLKQSRKKSSKRSRQETQSEDEDSEREDVNITAAAKKIRKVSTISSPSAAAAVSSLPRTPSNLRTPLSSPATSSRSNISSNKKLRMVQLEMELLHTDLKNVAFEEERRKRKEAMVLKRRLQSVRRMTELNDSYGEESEDDEL